jgi:anti-anti-sigma regulatory factor
VGVATSRPGDGIRAITLRGELTEAESASLRSILVDALWRERAAEVVVELHEDAVIDDTTVGSLLAAAGIASDQNLVMRLHCQNPVTAQKLAAVGLVDPSSTE